MTIESPQSFVVREECQKAASQNGFRRFLTKEAGWSAFGSTTAKGLIYLAATGSSGPWYLALDHLGIIQEFGFPGTDIPGPGYARFAFESLGRLYAALRRVYELGVSLPDAPLREFEIRVADLPKTTEAERLVVQRIGQDIFRARLMDYWKGCCPLTGISDSALLRASHIVPWAECESDAERLDIHNGLLLSALWDAAFDRALVTFDDEGRPEFSAGLSEAARAELRWRTPIALTDEHRERLAHHRDRARLLKGDLWQLTLVVNSERPNLTYTCILPARLGLPKDTKNKMVFARIEAKVVGEYAIWLVTEIQLV